MAAAISSLEHVGGTFLNARHAVRSIAFLKSSRLRRPDLVLTFGLPLVDSKGAGLSQAESARPRPVALAAREARADPAHISNPRPRHRADAGNRL